MIIKLYDIAEHLAVTGTVDGSKFKRPEDTDVSFLSPIGYDLTLVRSEQNVWLRGLVSAKLALMCDRCLEAYTYTVRADLDIELVPKNRTPDAPEVELRSEDLDQYYYEGEDIDLDPYVFEEVMLNIPIKALCAESCKGICPVCGKNLNSGECRCEKTGTSVLGEKLRSFLKES
jgi:uncharacterized protein